MKVYVSGASGFIGRYLCKYLDTQGIEVIAVSRSNNFSDNIRHIRVEKYSDLKISSGGTFIHLAENPNLNSITKKQQIEQSNFISHLLQQPIDRFVYASSAAVYGDQSTKEHSEIEKIDLEYVKSNYAIAKLAAEAIFLSDPRPNLVLRFSNIYGPGMSQSSVVMEIIRQILDGVQEIKLLSLTPVRDYLYISDAVSALALLLRSDQNGGIYNIGSGRGYAVADLFQIISGIFPDKKLTVKEMKNQKVFSSLVLDVSKLQRSFYWNPKVNIADGLKKILGEYL